jgi:prephenate dehydratase
MQKKKNIISFLGIYGSHSDMACRQAYPYMETMPCHTFEDAIKAVEDGNADLCMIPIENSNAGRVAEIHNLLPETNLYIVGEYFQKIENQLAAPKGASLESIKTVYSHPQPLMQCRKNLHKFGYETEAYTNTAAAAQDVAKWNDISKAAICSSLAADLYGLEIIKKNIEDNADNTTIFLAMSAEPIDPSPEEGRVITSIIFAARNIPSALYKALGGFATNQVNLLKIESYIPSGSSQTAQFFICFEGHPSQRNVQLAIEELGFFCRKVKVLGVYYGDKRRFE